MNNVNAIVQPEIFGGITLYNADCMDIMREMPDQAYDLAIVDPPYGIEVTKCGCGERRKRYDRKKKWDAQAPGVEYFDELMRVSRNRIIWGMNYFPAIFPVSNFIVWDKRQPDGVTYAQAELAAMTFPGTSKIFRYTANGQKPRIHPTQKPVELYEWLLRLFSRPGDKILDTHLGSGSIAIACDKAGLTLTGIELDPDYFRAAKKRLIDYQMQQKLF